MDITSVMLFLVKIFTQFKLEKSAVVYAAIRCTHAYHSVHSQILSFYIRQKPFW